MSISVCSDRFPPPMSKGNYSYDRAVIFEVVFFFCYRYFGPTAFQQPQPPSPPRQPPTTFSTTPTTTTSPQRKPHHSSPPSPQRTTSRLRLRKRCHLITGCSVRIEQHLCQTDAGVSSLRRAGDLCLVSSLRISRKSDQNRKKGGASGGSEVKDRRSNLASRAL